MKFRYFLAVIAAMTIGSVSSVAFGQTSVTDESGLRSAVQNASENDVIRLDADIDLTSGALVVAKEKTITIDLNDHVLRQTWVGKSGETDRVILNYGNLTVEDNASSKTVKYFAFDGENKKWTYTTKETTDYSVTGGVITGGNPHKTGLYDDGYGAGVQNSGTFTLKGGNICGNYAYSSGGGVAHGGDTPETYIRGGVISFNSADIGGGIRNYYDINRLTVTGGEISNNIAFYQGGGLGCDAGCIIGGTAVVIKNICTNDEKGIGNTVSNVSTWVPLKVSEPAEGMNVGVNLTVKAGDIGKGQFTESCSQSDYEIFSSDFDSYKVEYNKTNGYYEMVDKTTPPTPPTGNVCKNVQTEVEYTSLADAINALETTGQTIQMLSDITPADQITISGKSFTLDLNGKNISASSGKRIFEIASDAELTILNNNTDNGSGSYLYGNQTAIDGDGGIILNYGTLNFNGTKGEWRNVEFINGHAVNGGAIMNETGATLNSTEEIFMKITQLKKVEQLPTRVRSI